MDHAFYREYWGLGATHDYRLPAKWIGSDGRSMFLIFSSLKLSDCTTNDAFCVRRMTLDVTIEYGGRGGFSGLNSILQLECTVV